MIKAFKKLNQSDNVLNRIQDNVDFTFGEITKCPLLDGILLQNINLVAGTNKLEHTLAREPQGYIVVMKNNDAVIYDSQTQNTLSKRYLNLITDKDVVINLYIF